MNRYDLYKDSGVEWIGEIPSHWILKGLRFSFKINKGKIPKTLFDKRGDNMLPYLSMDVLRNNPPKEFSNQDDGLFVRKGDIGILWDGSNSGEIISINQDGILSSTVSRLGISDSKLNKEFSYYILKFYEKDFKENTIGMGIPHMDGNHLKFSKIILPPLSEQEQIVSFLDGKTLKIDSLIQQKEKKIELLKEKRTSLINHVVTKGLNPNVEMKDSGVEWIGEIPSSWNFIKIGFISKLLTGNPWKSDLFNFDEGVKILRGENVSEGFLRWGKRTRYWKEKVDIDSKFFVCSGDIIIPMDGSKVGKNFVRIKEEDLPILLHQRMSRIRLNKGYSPKYIEYFIGSDMFQHYITISKTDPMIPHITQKNIYDFYVSIPEFTEQQQIVEYLDKQTEEIETLIQLEQKKIDTLKEYRQSLISEVVTGKIRVCEEDNSLSLNSQTV